MGYIIYCTHTLCISMFIKSATVLDCENMIEYVTHQPTEHQQQVRCTRNGRTIGETLTCLDQLSHILFLVDIGSTLDHVINDCLKNINSQGIWTRNIGRLAIIWLVYMIYIYITIVQRFNSQGIICLIHLPRTIHHQRDPVLMSSWPLLRYVAIFRWMSWSKIPGETGLDVQSVDVCLQVLDLRQCKRARS